MVVWGHHLNRPRRQIVALIALTGVLQLSAGVGLAFVAGFGAVSDALARVSGWWFPATAGALALSLAGYFLAYDGIFTVEHGPRLPLGQLRAVVVAGFSGFLSLAPAALDVHALRAAGADQREAQVRAASLAGLEQGVLAICGCASAIVILLSRQAGVPGDVSWPWAIAPIPGFLVAFWAAERYRHRFTSTVGWRRGVGVFLDCIHLIREMFVHPRRYGAAILGMALFWVGEAAACWFGLAAFGLQLGVATFVVGFATGTLFTRRTGPFAGAGVMALVLPVTLWYCGAPLAAAVVGVFGYRVLCEWLPLPLALAHLPQLRRLDRLAQSRR